MADSLNGAESLIVVERSEPVEQKYQRQDKDGNMVDKTMFTFVVVFRLDGEADVLDVRRQFIVRDPQDEVSVDGKKLKPLVLNAKLNPELYRIVEATADEGSEWHDYSGQTTKNIVLIGKETIETRAKAEQILAA